MKPLADRTPDGQYKRLLWRILRYGERVQSQQGIDAITYMAPGIMRFRLNNGFPVITERNMDPKTSERLPVTIWQQAIGEIFAFINGARTLGELEAHGCYWWDKWATPEKCAKRGLEPGDLGPGSYGAAFHNFPTAEGGSFNQFEYILRQMRDQPQLRTHFVSPWIPQYAIRVTGRQQKVVVVPCHGWVHLRILNGKLTLHMFQRSGDAGVGVPSNMVQYFALLMAIAQVLGVEAYEFIHTISDAHIFVDQLPAVKTMLERESRPFPTMVLDQSITDLFAFRRGHFTLSDYNPHPGIKGIPVAI